MFERKFFPPVTRKYIVRRPGNPVPITLTSDGYWVFAAYDNKVDVAAIVKIELEGQEEPTIQVISTTKRNKVLMLIILLLPLPQLLILPLLLHLVSIEVKTRTASAIITVTKIHHRTMMVVDYLDHLMIMIQRTLLLMIIVLQS